MVYSFLSELTVSWRDVVDITLVTLLLYSIIVMIKKTRAVAAVYGLMSIIAVYLISRQLRLDTLNWILENVLASILLLVIIVFQKDIRHALTTIGSRRWWVLRFFRKKDGNANLQIIAEAAITMAQQRIGALIILERNVPLDDITDRGVILQARLSKELLISLFWPNSPLHDGAALIRGDSVYAGACILPLSTAVTKRDYGTRHRAALGITEETDAVAIVVSEERGVVAVALEGRITGNLDEAKLNRVLVAAMERTS